MARGNGNRGEGTADEIVDTAEAGESAALGAMSGTGSADAPITQGVMNPSPASNEGDTPPGLKEAEENAKLRAELGALQAKLLDPVTGQPRSDFSPDLNDPSAELAMRGTSASNRMGLANSGLGAMRARQAQEARYASAEEALAEARSLNEMPEQAMVVMPPQEYRARMQAVVSAEAAANTASFTVPGGRYLVNGETVNAQGDLIDDEGRVLQARNLA